MDDRDKGYYRKFKVERTDGSSGPGGKHERCAYFVLDLDHDRHAAPALKAYADSCRAEFPELADDLTSMAMGQIFSMQDLHAPEAVGHLLPRPLRECVINRAVQTPAREGAELLKVAPPAGIGLREWLAGQALPAVISCCRKGWPTITDHEEVAVLAVRAAAAVVKALGTPDPVASPPKREFLCHTDSRDYMLGEGHGVVLADTADQAAIAFANHVRSVGLSPGSRITVKLLDGTHPAPEVAYAVDPEGRVTGPIRA